MANKRILRRGLYLLAGILAGAPAMVVSFAADAHPRHHHGSHAVHLAPTNATTVPVNRDASNGTRQPQDRKAVKPDDAPANTPTRTAVGKGGKQPSGGSTEAATSAPAKDVNAPGLHTKDLGPIDTRITVRPRLYGAGPGTARQVKSKIGPIGSRYSQVRHAFTPGKAGHITRNAIGLPVTPQSTVPAPNAAFVRSPTAPSVAANGSDGLVKLSPGSDHSAVSRPGPVVTGTGAGPSAINGTSFARRGFGPATLGGPTKNVVAGINGSTIRPKH